MTPQEIQFLFTLRYNPLRKVNFKPRPVQDFLPDENHQDHHGLESALARSLLRIIKGKNKIAISHSAGVDSNVVLGLLRKANYSGEIWCLCMDGKEVQAAQKLADEKGANFMVVEPESVMVNIAKYVQITGEPRWNVYHHKIAETAVKLGCEVLLTGDGADEIFGGYVFRYRQFLDSGYTYFSEMYLDGHKNDRIRGMNEFFKNGWDSELIKGHLNQFNSSFLHGLEKVFYADFNGKLIYDFIPTSRAISAYHGIDIRSPFLDETVIDYGLAMPLEKKLDLVDMVGKLPLRKLLDSYGMDISKEKMGFTYDLVSDYNSHRGMWFDHHPKTFDMVNYKWMEENYKERSDYSVINKLAQIHCLSEWYKQNDSNR